jgi:uncharacterized protein
VKDDQYVVFNRTRDNCLADDVKPARSIFTRMKGLIGRSSQEFIAGQALWLIPSDGIHTIGMRFPIDAVYLDCNGRVLKLYRELAPFRVAAIKLKARSVLELPPGTLARTHTEVGDLLEFRPK